RSSEERDRNGPRFRSITKARHRDAPNELRKQASTLGRRQSMCPMNFPFKFQYKSRIFPQMNLRHLRTFVAIADGGGVTSAASRLNMTQPTASRQIDALENELGVSLFDRVGRGLQLTS